MSGITSSLIKDLREKTGAGMMDCKKALEASSNDLESAIDWLRKKGLAAVSKKAGRVTAEGLVAVHAHGSEGVVLEVNSETDFVARNAQFQTFVAHLLPIIQTSGSKTVDALLKKPFNDSQTVEEALSLAVATIGESLNIRRFAHLRVDHGVVASYVHSAVVPGMGKIGVLVALESSGPVDKLQELGKQIAMHVAASVPFFLKIQDVDGASLERERQVLTEQAKASGRPDDVIAKMVEGRLRKYYEEVVLEEQLFVMDGKTKISDLVAQQARDLGHEIVLKGFVRMGLGEGIEKVTTDFAADVAAQIK